MNIEAAFATVLSVIFLALYIKLLRWVVRKEGVNLE
ncbi:hypothetical protein IPdc08_01884 [archaeon]|nr:hypothetical protein IPdc08_01884 [archaeon]